MDRPPHRPRIGASTCRTCLPRTLPGERHAVLAAIDQGYRVIVALDALCSSSDETHDALMKLYSDRFGQQIEMADTETILSQWPKIA